MYYTNLEHFQIDELCLVTNETYKKKYNIKDIDNITTNMVYNIHNNDRVNNIYSKKHIILASLKKIFINPTKEKVAHDYNNIIDDHEKMIDKKLNKINIKKKRSSCLC